MESWTTPSAADGDLLEDSDVQDEEQDIHDLEEDEDGATLPSDGKLEGPLPSAAYAENTPTKCRLGAKRSRDAHSHIWKVINRCPRSHESIDKSGGCGTLRRYVVAKECWSF